MAGALALLVVVVLVVVATRGQRSGYDDSPAAQPLGGAPQPSEVVAPNVASIRAGLERLAVRPETPTGYDRALFEHWIDEDGDGCDTRAEVLISESEIQVQVGAGCRLSGGRWFSTYDGFVIEVTGELDIDHMVPLKEAWDSGAASWSESRRRDYANDLGSSISLRAVTGSSNRSKSDKDPSQWLPTNDAAVCTYLSEWISVKLKWELAVDVEERSAILDAASRHCES